MKSQVLFSVKNTKENKMLSVAILLSTLKIKRHSEKESMSIFRKKKKNGKNI